jgi:hypothetical protein
MPFLLNAQEQQVSELDRKISVQIEHGRLIDLFNEISFQTGIYFSYDPLLVGPEKPLSVNFENQSIQTILDNVLNENLHFQLLKNQLIIIKNPVNIEEKIMEESPPDAAINLSGRLFDQKTAGRIAFASISVLGEAFGTITNVDGEFAMKIPPQYETDTLVISCMGYAQKLVLLDTLQQTSLHLAMVPVDIQLGEVKVTAISPLAVMDSLIFNIEKNYPTHTHLMTSFYREVLKQDKDYVNVSEAVMHILKASYSNQFREDQIKYLKGRKSPDVQSFQMVDFKMQGGPYYTTKLDVIKTMDSFIDKEYRNFYKYDIDQVILYNERPTFVISFKPDGKFDYLTYEGKLFIDRESFALVHAEFSLSRDGKKSARKSLIRKKPKGFNVRPIDLDYQVTYKQYGGKWYLNSAQTSVKFHVRSRHDKINAVFHSISDLLITDHHETQLRRFKRTEDFDPSDIFTETITDYDEGFWGNYNVIKPSDSLRKALKKGTKEESSDQTILQPDHLTFQIEEK